MANMYDAEIRAPGSGRTIHVVPIRTALNLEKAQALYEMLTGNQVTANPTSPLSSLLRGETVGARVQVVDGGGPKAELIIRRTR